MARPQEPQHFRREQCTTTRLLCAPPRLVRLSPPRRSCRAVRGSANPHGPGTHYPLPSGRCRRPSQGLVREDGAELVVVLTNLCSGGAIRFELQPCSSSGQPLARPSLNRVNVLQPGESVRVDCDQARAVSDAASPRSASWKIISDARARTLAARRPPRLRWWSAPSTTARARVSRFGTSWRRLQKPGWGRTSEHMSSPRRAFAVRSFVATKSNGCACTITRPNELGGCCCAGHPSCSAALRPRNALGLQGRVCAD